MSASSEADTGQRTGRSNDSGAGRGRHPVVGLADVAHVVKASGQGERSDQEPSPEGLPQPALRLAAALALYNVALGIGCCLLIAQLLLSPELLPAVGAAASSGEGAQLTVRYLGFTALGAVLGAILLNLLGLHVHVAVLADFKSRFAGSYLLGPFAAALLGFVIFTILQSGLLAIGGEITSSEEAVRASLFYLAIGVLTGFAWDTVIVRISGVARQIFGGQQERQPLVRTGSGRTSPRDHHPEQSAPAPHAGEPGRGS